MRLIAEMKLGLVGSDAEICVRLYEPEPDQNHDWGCTFEIDAPIAVKRDC